MSDTDTTELSVTEAGITVTKSYQTDEFPVPAVVFDVRSEREDAAALRLVDTVPDGVPSEDLGFHPDYDSDRWSVENGAAVFERRFDPDEEYRTVYGVRTTDTDPAAFMTEPELDVEGSGDSDPEATETESEAGDDEPETPSNEPATDEEATTPGRDSTEAARDIIRGDDTVSGLSDDDAVENVNLSEDSTAETTSPPEPTETAESTETAETTPALGTDDTPSADSTADGTGAAVSAGGVGAALAAELREGTLSESDRELLARELGGHRDGSGVRISHLQSRISDIEAYTDAIEGFVDENGPARQLVEDLTGRLDAIESDLAAVDERTAENETTIAELDSVDERTAQNETDIEALHGRITRNEDDIEALDKGIADTNAEVAETRESVAENREEIAAIADWRDRISTVFGGVSDSEDDA